MKEYYPWKMLSDQQKGELLLAYYKRKSIQQKHFGEGKWSELKDWPPKSNSTIFYRVQPIEVAKLFIREDYDYIEIGTITMINGKPDVKSVKLEQTK